MEGLDMSKADKVVVYISDWRQEVVEDELIVTSKEDIYKMLDDGVSTSDIAKAAIVSRELGVVEESILRPNKLLLLSGARADVAQVYAKLKREVSAANGQTFKVPVYVGRMRGYHRTESDAYELAVDSELEDDEVSYVNAEDHPNQAAERARVRLLEAIPGYIWNMLLQIHAAGGDVKGSIEELQKIEKEMVKRITDPKAPTNRKQ